MVSGLQKRVPLRRKLQNLSSLTKMKSVKRSSIVMEALLQIYMLKLKLEAVQREYLYVRALKTDFLNLIKHSQVPKEVKVEKIEEGFLVRVKCENAGDTLVSVLEAFEEMRLTVLRATISSNNFFSMEAIAVAENQDQLDVRDVTQAITRATEINEHGRLVAPQVDNS